MQRPEPGQVWERDGKRREVVRVDDCGSGFFVSWCRPGTAKVRECWCSTWDEWASKATLVEGSNGGEAAVDH